MNPFNKLSGISKERERIPEEQTTLEKLLELETEVIRKFSAEKSNIFDYIRAKN